MRLSPPIPQPKAAKPANWKAADRKGSEEAKKRSGGRCEVVELVTIGYYQPIPARCMKRAVHIHHAIMGWRIRGRGASAKAENKLHVCALCHADIHARVLRRMADGTFKRVGQ